MLWYFPCIILLWYAPKWVGLSSANGFFYPVVDNQLMSVAEVRNLKSLYWYHSNTIPLFSENHFFDNRSYFSSFLKELKEKKSVSIFTTETDFFIAITSTWYSFSKSRLVCAYNVWTYSATTSKVNSAETSLYNFTIAVKVPTVFTSFSTMLLRSTSMPALANSSATCALVTEP